MFESTEIILLLEKFLVNMNSLVADLDQSTKILTQRTRRMEDAKLFPLAFFVSLPLCVENRFCKSVHGFGYNPIIA